MGPTFKIAALFKNHQLSDILFFLFENRFASISFFGKEVFFYFKPKYRRHIPLLNVVEGCAAYIIIHHLSLAEV